MEKIIKSLLFAIPIMLGCNHSETPMPVVNTLEAKRYMGTWYEIARLPNKGAVGLGISFYTTQSCLQQNTAYTVRPNPKSLFFFPCLKWHLLSWPQYHRYGTSVCHLFYRLADDGMRI